MHGLEYDNGNCSYDAYKLFLLDVNGPANRGSFLTLGVCPLFLCPCVSLSPPSLSHTLPIPMHFILK